MAGLRKILLVDDDAFALKLIRHQLSQLGYTEVEAFADPHAVGLLRVPADAQRERLRGGDLGVRRSGDQERAGIGGGAETDRAEHERQQARLERLAELLLADKAAEAGQRVHRGGCGRQVRYSM